MSGGRQPGGDPTQRRSCLITGRVQMVGFRAFAAYHGQRLGLQGWVRNRPSGEVEVLVEGSESQLDAYLTLLEEGPAAAEVESMVVSEAAGGSPLAGFRALP